MTGEAEAERRLGGEASDPQILNGDFETTTERQLYSQLVLRVRSHAGHRCESSVGKPLCTI